MSSICVNSLIEEEPFMTVLCLNTSTRRTSITSAVSRALATTVDDRTVAKKV